MNNVNKGNSLVPSKFYETLLSNLQDIVETKKFYVRYIYMFEVMLRRTRTTNNATKNPLCSALI